MLVCGGIHSEFLHFYLPRLKCYLLYASIDWASGRVLAFAFVFTAHFQMFFLNAFGCLPTLFVVPPSGGPARRSNRPPEGGTTNRVGERIGKRV